MIELKKMVWRNFLSYGNRKTEYDFQKGVSRIFAPIGEGKSALVDVLYFGFFGKPYRKIKLEQLVNWITKRRLEVEITFNSNGKEYRIERGLIPKYFKIYENDKLIDQDARKLDYQSYLEESILKINERVFNQIVVKTLTRSISFFTLKKDEKRKLVEDMFGIEVFSKMREISIKKFSDIEFEIKNKKEEKIAYENLLKQEKRNLDNLKKIKKDFLTKNEELKKEYLLEIGELETQIIFNEEGIVRFKRISAKEDTLKEELKELKKYLKEQKDSERKLLIEKRSDEAKKEFFQSNCPGCAKVNEYIDLEKNKEYDIEEVRKIIGEYNIKVEDHEKKLKKYDVIALKAKTMKNEITQSKKKITQLQSKISSLKQDIKIDETKFNDFKNKIDHFDTLLKLNYYEFNYQKIIQELLQDTGIKKYIIRKRLPVLNNLLKMFLQKFEIPIYFKFDENFNDVVETKFKESSSYFSFSEGQKKLIDLAVVFAFLSFSKLRNQKSDINILILDEIDSGLDAEGRNILFEVLKDASNNELKEIITVSHAMDVDNDMIDRAFQVKMENGFSTINKLEL